MRFLALMLMLPLAAAAQQENDTLQQLTISNVTVVGYRYAAPVRSADGISIWDLRKIDDMPHILGNADPMHLAQMLPGIQTNNEYDGGLHVQGSDTQHNLITLDGVPIYNAAHLLGIFSVFNTSHFDRMSFTRSPSASASRIGAQLDMQTGDTIVTRLHGQLDVGPMSAQGTLRVPLGKGLSMTLSARNAYLNLLYGRWLRADDQQYSYSFGDYNATLQWHPSCRDRITLQGYLGYDRISMDVGEMSTDAYLRWGNYMASASWEHSARWSMRHTLYTTAYSNKLVFSINRTEATMPSSITDYGYNFDLTAGNTTAGLNAIVHRASPQHPSVTGFYNTVLSPSVPSFPSSSPRSVATYTTHEASAFIERRIPLSPRLSLKAGLRLSAFLDEHRHLFTYADPSASLSWLPREGTSLQLLFSSNHQFVTQTGFSNMSLPSEFWITANSQRPPQAGRTVSMRARQSLMRGRWIVEAEAYHRWLNHQVEYSGTLLDLVTTAYDLNESLLHGRGRAYGISLSLTKATGWLTGWVAYSWGRSRRTFNDERHSAWYPANHERIHELDAVATAHVSRRWNLGATLVAASGTPFTAPKAFYFYNGSIVSEYSEHNANRLRPYLRLDLSANYFFHREDGGDNRGGEKLRSWVRESGINISLYNATYHYNDIFYRLKIYEGEYSYRPVRFILTIMPSISYFLKF